MSRSNHQTQARSDHDATQNPETLTDAAEEVGTASRHLKEAGVEIANSVSSARRSASESLQRTRQRVESGYSDALERTKKAVHRGRDEVSKRPKTAALALVGAGLVAGVIATSLARRPRA